MRKGQAALISRVPNTDFDVLLFNGGLDTETPGWQVKPGYLADSLNYEIGISGGYQDVMGYERFDGLPAPSDAQYAVIDVTISGSIEVGDTITGANSGATAEVIVVDTAFLVITKITDTFEDGEDLEVSASVEGSTDSTARVDGAASLLLHAQYLNLAADAYRADIAVVPGSGPVRGLFGLANTLYAWRNNAGGTAAVLHVQHASTGWTEVPLSRTVAFTSGGTYVIADGDTITGATSGATAVVGRVILTSGTWAAGDAAGTLYLDDQGVTDFQAENLNVGANLNVATIAGNSAAATMLPGGRFEVVIDNFGGDAGTTRAYGCDGVNAPWEFDGTTFVTIGTGMSSKPSHIAVHKQHLFCSFGSSVQHSAQGDPYTWTPILGAGEIGTGDTVTGFSVEPGAEGNAALAIYDRNRAYVLYGNDVDDWNLVTYRHELGAYPYTIAQVSYSVFLDDRGVSTLRTGQDFGNFQHATLSQRIQTFIDAHKAASVAACIVREKNQYRLFFSDQSALYVTFDGKQVAGMMPVQLAHVPACTASFELSTGSEKVFFGATNGFVYQMERGTSFDGDAISAYLTTHFHFGRSLGWNKSYYGCVLEGKGGGYAGYEFSYQLGYGDPEIPPTMNQSGVLALSAGRWDIGVWDTGFWDGRSLLPSELEMHGLGENVALSIRKSSDYFEPILWTGARMRYVTRRQRRR